MLLYIVETIILWCAIWAVSPLYPWLAIGLGIVFLVKSYITYEVMKRVKAQKELQKRLKVVSGHIQIPEGVDMKDFIADGLTKELQKMIREVEKKEEDEG